MTSVRSIRAHLASFSSRYPSASGVSRCTELLATAARPCSRSHFVPGHITASACVVSAQGSMLLVHHAKLRRWLQPGGHVESEDATLLDAARREVAEECGVSELREIRPTSASGPIDVDIHEIPARGTEPAHLHFDLRYGFRASEELPLVVSGESLDVRWIAQDALPQHAPDAGIRRMLRRCLECGGSAGDGELESSPHAPLSVRAETPDDHASVDRIQRAAFGRPDEARLVCALRASAPPRVSLVAERDQEVVGHVFLSPVSIEGASVSLSAAGLAPLAVAPNAQGCGVGSALVRAGLQASASVGWKAVFLLGEPEYYSRFGFVLAAPLGLHYESAEFDAAFQVRELAPGALSGCRGQVRYRDAFSQLGGEP